MSATILGLGQWLPPEVRTNDFWSEEIVAAWRARPEATLAGMDRTLATVPEGLPGKLVTRHLAQERQDPFLGAKQRHVASRADKSYEASAKAARVALQDASVEPQQVNVVLAFEAVPDRPAMSGAAKIAELSGATSASAITVDSAFASSLAQLELACGLVDSGRADYVLCTQSFLVTPTYPSSHPVLPALGDAATAFVVAAGNQRSVLGTHSRSDGRYHDAICWTRGRDDQTDTPWWSAGGAFQYGSRDPARAVEIIQETVPWGALALRAAAERARLDPRTLDLIVSVHPRCWVPGGIAEQLGLPPERAVHTFQQTAYTGACCLVTNLLEARRSGQLQREALIGLYAQGPGFTSSAAVVRWACD